MIGPSTVTQLPGMIRPPAVGSACPREPTGVFVTAPHRCEGKAARYQHRTRAGDRSSIAQLAGTIRPPAVRLARSRHAAGVVATRAHGLEDHTTSHRHGSRPGAGLIVSPAVGGARGRYPAGVMAPGTDLGEAQAAQNESRTELYFQGIAAVAELTVIIGSPTIGVARGRDPAGVAVPGAHREEGPGIESGDREGYRG